MAAVNRVWDTLVGGANKFVRWTTDAPDPTGVSYPGPGVYGINTSDYVVERIDAEVPAAAIEYSGGGNWADATTNPATNTELQLDKIISDLAGAAGSAKIQSGAQAGAPNSLSAGTLFSQLVALLGHGNTNATGLSNHLSSVTAHPAANITNTPAGTIAATTVQAAVNELDGDVQGHITNPTGAHAATAISNTPAGNIAAVNVQTALNELDTEKAGLALANSFTTSQTVNTGSDTTPRLIGTDLPVGSYQLVARFTLSGSTFTRVYVASAGGMVITHNAFFSAAVWNKDNAGANSMALFILNNANMSYMRRAAVAGTWTVWDSYVNLNSSTQSIDFFPSTVAFDGTTGSISGPGSITSYTGFRSRSVTAGELVGADVNWKKVFPAAPASVTFSIIGSNNITGPTLTSVSNTAFGSGVSATATSNNTDTYFFATVTAV